MIVCKKGFSYTTCPKNKRNKHGCKFCKDAIHREIER